MTILANACVARPTSDVHFNKAVVEKLEAAPIGWVKDPSANLEKDATSITLKVHLVNQGMSKFHDLAMDVRLCQNGSLINSELKPLIRLLLLATHNTETILTTKQSLL